MKIRPAVLIIQDDSILTMHYCYGGQDVYNLPGGNLEFGEFLADALSRELEEELSVKASIGDLIMVGEVHFPEHHKQTIHFIFEGKITEGIPVLNPVHTSALAVEWIKIADLDKVHLYPNVSEHIKAYLAGNLPDVYIGKLNQLWF
ncbi:NUDIX domain-containing protein [Emticicia sp. 17c]|uniref:NUDIX domain-containing protein n=1 Tax=Emticicia sp. 17c TaxID=3127704 RepID=UPI00301BB66F